MLAGVIDSDLSRLTDGGGSGISDLTRITSRIGADVGVGGNGRTDAEREGVFTVGRDDGGAMMAFGF
jgi:hypothetical protein